MSRSAFTVFFLLSSLIPGAAPAKEPINYASASGRVTDPARAAVEGAQVTARQTDTNLLSAAKTDREGRFRFPYLKVGRYEIKVQKQGFPDPVLSLTLTVGAAFALPVTLP